MTFLGTAGKINENDIDKNAVKDSEILFLEGYLWDEGEPKKAFEKAINSSNKVAMSLSCLLYTSPSPRDDELSRMPSSA